MSRSDSLHTPEPFRDTFPHGSKRAERPISRCYPVIDSDIARDNLENDIPDADLQDL